MAKNYVQRGEVFSHTTSAAVKSGQVVVVEALVGVALTDAEAGADAVLGVTGVYSIPAATDEIKAGAKVYWAAAGDPVGGTAGTGAATATSTNNTYAGIAWATKPATKGQVLVKLG